MYEICLLKVQDLKYDIVIERCFQILWTFGPVITAWSEINWFMYYMDKYVKFESAVPLFEIHYWKGYNHAFH